MASNRRNSVRPSGWFSTDGISPVARRKSYRPASLALVMPERRPEAAMDGWEKAFGFFSRHLSS
jgi:hypothetical protein